MNFSDFDDYSLIIQDGSTDVKIGNSCVETSTPLAKRTRNKFQVKYGDISQIDVVISPSSDTCYTSLETPYSEYTTNNCSHFTSNFSSPQLSGNFNKSTEKEKANGADQNAKGIPKSVVLLEKLTTSFISKAVSKDTDKQSLNSLNGSVSLFSTPGNNAKENIKLLTSRLQQISFIDNEVIDKSDSKKEKELYEDETEGEEEELDKDESDEEENDEYEEESSKELSALTEKEEVGSDSEAGDRGKADDSELVSQSGTLDVRVTRSAKHKVTSAVSKEKRDKLSVVEGKEEDSDDDNDYIIDKQNDSVDDDVDKDEDEEDVTDDNDDTDDNVVTDDNDVTYDNVDEDIDSDEDYVDDEDNDLSEDQSEESDDDEVGLNIKKLNRSLQNNRISVRLRGSRRQKTVDVDAIIETFESPEIDSSKSDCDLYMLNEHYKAGADLGGNGSSDLFSESESENSEYTSARSSDTVYNNGHESRKFRNSQTSDGADVIDDVDEKMDNDDDEYHSAKEISNRESLVCMQGSLCCCAEQPP